jgi:hypothetical protein
MEVEKQSRYQKYRQSIIKSTLKYRASHKQQYNDYQRNRYNSNPTAREKKLALMRAYSARKRAEKKNQRQQQPA